mgnify:FL=1
MKRLFIYIVTVMALFIAGCYEDKGNYDYDTVPQVSVSGIEKSYDFYVGSQETITPTVTWTNGKPDKVSYAWRINNKVVCEEESLNLLWETFP